MARGAGEDSIADQGAAVWRVEVDMHPAQQDIWESDARFKVIAAGRRFGKTLLGSGKAITTALSKPNAVVWWVSPSHPQSRIAQRMVANAIPKKHRDVNRTLGEIYLSNGGRIAFKSGERWDNLRGEGLDLVIVDEAAFVDENVWIQALRPALSANNGHAILISTFNGENWFYDLYRFALDPNNTEWEGWRFPTSANPYIPPGEIDEARRSLPKEVFEQEYLASPLAFSGAVFEGDKLDAAYERRDSFTLPTYPLCDAGLDWGWNVTALEVCTELADGRIAWIDEAIYEKIELNDRCHLIADVCIQHRVQTIYCDAAGASENVTLAKILEQRGAPTFVQPVPFAVYKKPGILTRSFYLQQGREILTDNTIQLLVDSKSYHYNSAPGQEEKPAKGRDHTVDAATAYYASRADVLGDEILREAS